MRHVVADIETDNLLDALTTVHCLVIRDVDTDELVSCSSHAGNIERGLEILRNAERIYGHNFIKFDYPALQKVYPTFSLRRDQIRDTMVIAQMRWAHIKDTDFARAKGLGMPGYLCGSHSLEAWGYRLGVHKGEYTDWCKANGIENAWAQWRPEMQTYCEGDTATTKALVLHIRKYGVSPEAVEIEHELAWYLAAQERAGVPFDVEKAYALQAKLAARREEIGAQMRAEFGPRYKKDGPPFTPKKDIKPRGVVGGAQYQKLKLVDFNPSSRPDIIYHLTTRFGWQPTEFTDSGQAELNEKTLKGLNASIPAVKLLLEYLLVEKRLGQLAEGQEAWLRHARTNGPEGGALTGLHHIHGRIKQNAAITHRASHSSPNLSAVPKVGKAFGEECRELFYVPPIKVPAEHQWVLVGADASSLEARCLAHYLARYDGGEYGKLLLEGDPHTANRIALGLPGDSPLVAKVARDGAKTWFYAWMYGGGDFKLGNLLAFLALPDGTRLLSPPKGGWTKDAISQLGARVKKQFLKNMPAFGGLIDDVQKATKQKGYVLLPDGRRAYVRSEHSALNTLLQGAGAIIVKRWIANYSPIVWRELGEPSWRGEWVPLLWSHDETQTGVRRRHEAWLRDLLTSEMVKVGEHFKWRLPLAGEAKTGLNWKDTH